LKLYLSFILFLITLSFDFIGRYFLTDNPTFSAIFLSSITLTSVIILLDLGYYFVDLNKNKFFRNSYLIIISLSLAVILLLNLMSAYYFKEFLTYEMFNYLKGDIQSVYNLIRSYVINIEFMMAFLTIATVIFILIKKTTFLPYKNMKIATFILMVTVISTYLSANSLTWHPSYSSADILSSTLVSFKRGLSQMNQNNYLYSSIHTSLQKESIRPQYNIILIYHESWGKDATELYDASKEVMPYLKNFYESHRPTFIKFKRAYTNSTATDLSVPVILTGIESTSELDKFQKIPFLWNWAEAFNMSSLLVSSQRFEWARFDKYFLSSPPQETITAENSNSPIIHDIGIDDHIGTKIFVEKLALLSSKEPFLAILNTNGMHAPFQRSSDYFSPSEDFSPYQKSAQIVDHAMKPFFDLLQSHSLLDNTFIIFTSDHGEKDKPIHKASRIYSPYEEFINIPFLIKVPSSWKKENPLLFKNLKDNENVNISNIDIVPTILDIVSLKEASQWNKKVSTLLDGRSLLTKISNERIIKVSTINDFRKWNKEAFTIIKGSRRLTFTSSKGPEIYLLDQDPEQKRPLSDNFFKEELKTFLPIINKDKHFKRMFRDKIK